MMLLVLLVQLLNLCIVIHSAENVLCPVSRSAGYSNHGNLNYPLQIFFPHVYNALNVTCVRNSEFRLYENSNLSCPVKPAGCPLIEENFQEAVRLSRSWTKSSSLCNLKDTLNGKHDRSRFIVMGGSVTTGVDSVGCCNRPECFREICRHCSWVHHLKLWLQSSNKAIEVHNLGDPGTTSIFSGDTVHLKMNESNLGNFTSKDVIFIDHSFNDNTLSVPIENFKLQRGLEKLIRSLYNMAVSLSDLPHIILFVADTRVMGREQDRFTNHYQLLAKHYGLRYYSFPDALSSNASLTKQAVYHDHLTHKDRGDDHPPWYLQLVYADLIAGLLLSEISQCEAGTNASAAADTAPFVMPEPVLPVEGSTSCKTNTQPLVKISHKLLTMNTSIGVYNVERPDTWELKLDRKRRGGIIIEMEAHSDYHTMNEAPIHFPLDITAGQFRSMKLMLQVQFMRSYTDSGRVSVFLCDEWVTDLDALWPEYSKYPYTLYDAYTEQLNPERCREKKDNDPVVLTVRYRPDEEISHGLVKKKRKNHDSPRGNQLFKLGTVLVCQYESVKLY